MLRTFAIFLILGYYVSSAVARHRRMDAAARRPAASGPSPAPRRKWDMVDERADQSFPASDPPGTY